MLSLALLILLGAAHPVELPLNNVDRDPQSSAITLAETKAFFVVPVRERGRNLRNFSLVRQLEIFFYGNQVRHPPAIYLATCFAMNGKPGADLLRQTLKVPGSDLDTRDMAMLLKTMQAMGTYDVRGDLELMTLLKDRVSVMMDAGWKDTAEGMVSSIEETNLPSTPDAPDCGRSIP